MMTTEKDEGLVATDFEDYVHSFTFPNHLIVAHAKWLTGKWFGWRITWGDRQLAISDLKRMYRHRRVAGNPTA